MAAAAGEQPGRGPPRDRDRDYETWAITSQLVYTLYRVLGADQFAELVVVDNASADGSVQTLRALEEAGLVT